MVVAVEIHTADSQSLLKRDQDFSWLQDLNPLMLRRNPQRHLMRHQYLVGLLADSVQIISIQEVLRVVCVFN